MSDQEIEHLYLLHRTPFTGWAYSQFGLAEKDALEVYQDAVLAFVRNVRNGRFDPEICGPATYLYAIGRNLALKLLRDRKDHLGLEEPDALLLSMAPEWDGQEKEAHDQHTLKTGMAGLTERERQILRLYYHEHRSMSEIATIMGYKNADVAKKMKHLSFRKLAGLIAQTMLPLIALYVE
jgi:RNA polymerase sigma-70 factor (ECF subfamily)